MPPLNIVILAAGKGTRMHSDKPKVLHAVAGKPLLGHVIDCAQQLSPEKIVVVYGFGGEQVPQAFEAKTLLWAVQTQQLGTGHAVQQAMPHLDADGVSLILLGDVPLIEPATCRALLERATHALVLLTVKKDDPTGYGGRSRK
jgi:bifunctional UDP-N-acetylglucosamine pyrophosphorylase/glucosamine-1-phosphate N-acetyltransferase